MFGKSKKGAGYNYIIAVKDYQNTLRAIDDGSLFLHVNKEAYTKLFDGQIASVDNLSELRKFMRKCGKDKSEVGRYWESLIAGGYTIIAVQYDEESPSMEKMCENSPVKLVSTTG